MCPTELDPYHSPTKEDPTRIDSELLPDGPVFYSSQMEVERWQQLRERIQDGPYGTTFTQLLVVLLATIGAHMPRVTSDMLLLVFEPVHPYGDDQHKIIEQIYEMARSPDAQPVIRLHHRAELVWTAFMGPFLPHHIPATAIYDQPSPFFQSNVIKPTIDKLDALGLHLDLQQVLDVRARLQPLLPIDLIGECEINLPTSLSTFETFNRSVSEVRDHIVDPIEENWIIIIALSRSNEGSAFVESWCHDLNVHRAFYSVMQQFRQERSHKVQLALLLVAYLIHFYLFGKVRAYDDKPQLLDKLSRRNCDLLAEAVRSYAGITGLEGMLKALTSPKLGLDSDLPSDRNRCWEAIWTHLIVWDIDQGSDHYLKAETSHQSFGEEISPLSVGRWQSWTQWYRPCLGSRR